MNTFGNSACQTWRPRAAAQRLQTGPPPGTADWPRRSACYDRKGMACGRRPDRNCKPSWVTCVGYPPGVSTQPAGSEGLDRQFAEIAAVLRGPWVPPDAEGPRVLRVYAYDGARRSVEMRWFIRFWRLRVR